MAGNIVVLNGTSSSGKTSIAKALQEREQLYLHVSIDDLYGFLPDWFRYSRSERWPTVNLQLQEALFKTVAVLAEQGYNVIVDTVLIDSRDVRQCVLTLLEQNVWLIGLHCPLEETERREKARGDRAVGRAREQFALIHAHDLYDLELDTSALTPEACAALIEDHLGTHRGDALTKLLAKLPES